MGYQLWTSPKTGYRRRGTRLIDLRYAVGAGIITRTILEPLQCCQSDAPAVEMNRILEGRGFDTAGVQALKGGPVLGFVLTSELRDGLVKNHLKPLMSNHVISEATPLGELFTVLRGREQAFVIIGSEVRAIVTRADLNKPPVRVYLFGLLSLLEMHMQFWIHQVYSAESWKQQLKRERLDAADKLQRERRARNEDITLLDCLQFCDKRDLLLANELLRKKLGLTSKGKASSMFKGAEDLRNRLAHSQQDLVQGSTWEAHIELVTKVEELVHLSDEAVEQDAKASGTSGDGLWMAAQGAP
jgi:hypothetical protein